jgi:hypothetical protein
VNIAVEALYMLYEQAAQLQAAAVLTVAFTGSKYQSYFKSKYQTH